MQQTYCIYQKENVTYAEAMSFLSDVIQTMHLIMHEDGSTVEMDSTTAKVMKSSAYFDVIKHVSYANGDEEYS